MPSRSQDSGDGGRINNLTMLEWFYGIVFLLCAIGFLNVYSSTLYMNLENGDSPYAHVLRQGFSFLAGLVMWAVGRFWPAAYRKSFIHLFLWGTVLLLLLVFVGGRSVNGATRWLAIGPLSLQPSELAKVAAILWAAERLDRLMTAGRPVSFLSGLFHYMLRAPFHGEVQTFGAMLRGYGPLLVPLLLAGLVLLQPDMGTAVLIVAFPIALYVICGAPWGDVFSAAAFGVIGLFLIAMLEPYRRARLEVLYDPFADASGSGYQTVQSLIAVGSGGVFGQGAGEGLAKFLYLPEQYTDFAFAVLSQEGGFIASAVVLFLFAALLVVGFWMAHRIPRLYPSLLVYGLTMLISGEAFLNIAMVIGSFPVTGVPLPFISYGGTSLMVNLYAVGLIAGAVHEGERIRLREERKRKLGMLGAEPLSLRKLSGAVFIPPHEDRYRNE